MGSIHWKLSRAFVPDGYITVDEQLLPCKARCKFIQFMASKPDKFGIKFWLAADVQNKYVFNGIPYTGRDATRAPDTVSVATDMKLLTPLFNKGYHVTCDNFFTSISLARKLLTKKCTLVGTVRRNRRELPPEILRKQDLHETTVLKTDDRMTLTSYQCKASRSVFILSSLHDDVSVQQNENQKKKPETVIFYNHNKVAIDVVDQMIRKYSTRSACRRWPLHVLFNILDIALSNSWIIYKCAIPRLVAGSSSRKWAKSWLDTFRWWILQLPMKTMDRTTERDEHAQQDCATRIERLIGAFLAGNPFAESALSKNAPHSNCWFAK